ncbi:MAG: AMP-binding protein [Vicinamibacterales bacterium]
MIPLVEAAPRDRVALLEPERGRTVTYGDLVALVDTAADRLLAATDRRALVFLAPSTDVGGVVWYLACLRAGCPVALLEPSAEALSPVVEAYGPDLLVLPEALEPPAGYVRVPGGDDEDAYRVWRAVRAAAAPALHPELAALLTTSGSTGNPKLVRLTAANLASNAMAIREYLALDGAERAIQSLPMHYAYGLSVLNSHLAAGASLVLTPHSFMRPEFWRSVDEMGCTSFAGVPYMYQTLHRLRFNPAKHPGLRTFTQAGGALRLDLTAHFRDVTAAAGARFFVMYGQTEATARISYVPPLRLVDKIGSIGVAIPGGALSLRPVDGSDGMEEIVYQGPNVMLGYAESAADLALGDVQQGLLATGDLGRVDADGFYSVVGRLKRFAKLFGRRVNLEDIERFVEARAPVNAAAVDGGDQVILYVASDREVAPEPIVGQVARFLGVPPKAVALRAIDAIPMTVAGKKNYKALEGLERVAS